MTGDTLGGASPKPPNKKKLSQDETILSKKELCESPQAEGREPPGCGFPLPPTQGQALGSFGNIQMMGEKDAAENETI